ncbi:F-box/LRR-repeat protein 4-like isoform X2 [Euwallacea fornicatus]|uniref:F-box/LRR-repeat protein 4-like isoform X2 n=1 Tax=Euwallacea fornicatus TaxID=995702 RepID=UPI00339010AF
MFTQLANHATMDSLGEHLSKDEWLVYNTLPFILPFLTVPDVLHCRQVCTLWMRIVNDSTYWCAVTLRNYKLTLDKMTDFLQGFKTNHLKLVDCEYVDECTTSCFEILTHLKKLELSNCTSKLVETIAEGNPNLEVLRVSLIVCPSALKLDLSFVSKMPRLKQLTIYCHREVQHLKEMFTTLGNLEKLWLLRVTHIDFEDLPSSMNLDRYPQLQSLGLGHCTELPSTIVYFVKTFPNLRELCFEYCGSSKWDPVDIFNFLRELPSLRRLHLIEFNIKEGFDKGLKLCTNLEELTISPCCNRFFMGRFNGRIFEGVKNLKLKRFTWGFSATYMMHCKRIFEVADRVPFVSDADCLHGSLGGIESELKSWRLITLEDLQHELQELMKTCRVRVVKNYSPQDFF